MAAQQYDPADYFVEMQEVFVPLTWEIVLSNDNNINDETAWNNLDANARRNLRTKGFIKEHYKKLRRQFISYNIRMNLGLLNEEQYGREIRELTTNFVAPHA